MTRFLPFGSRSRVIQINSLWGGGGGWVTRDWLVAEYLLATNSLDTSGNGYNLTDTNVTYSSGSALYDTTANSYNSNDLYTTTSYSTSFWFRANAKSGGVQYLWANQWVEAGMYFDGNFNYVQRFVSWYSTITTGSGMTNWTWYHCVAMTTPAGMQIYLDGALVASNTNMWTPTTFSAGMWLWENGFGNSSNINVKKFRIYNRVLNAWEIAALYADS